jgi:hypothetical protein
VRRGRRTLRRFSEGSTFRERQLVLFVTKGMHTILSAHCLGNDRCKFRTNIRRHVCFALKIEAAVSPETSGLMYGVTS